ncbi:MAG: HAD-IIA family hydrolase [Clostridiales bacterium]|jgi:HAD superfamily hydrolase (TIGR01450 family)|nr:HAD-IIA family hydrolase [Clostridiales bacterium]
MNTEEIKKIKTYLIDMDGTVYLGGKLLPGAAEAVAALRRSGARICFLTNNSSVSARDYLQKLARLGIPVTADEIYTSQAATVAYVKKRYPDKSVYLLGTPALQSDFSDNGIAVTETDPDLAVIGYDTTLTYARLAKFCGLVRKGLPYIATHPDLNCPSPEGMLPDAGSMIELIYASAGRRPDIICGKPHAPMYDGVAEKFRITDPRTVAMVGDRMTTDLAFAKNNGFVGILVLTGETTPGLLKEIVARDPAQEPDLVLESICGLTEYVCKKSCKS